MRKRINLALIAFALIAIAGSSCAFDGQRKGKVLAMGFGYVAAGPHIITPDKTTYRPGMAFRIVAGYAISNRTMFTFGVARQAIFYSNERGNYMDGVNWMLELSMTRYLKEDAHSAFWRAGLGLMDWGAWGIPRVALSERSRDFNLALVGGVGYMFLKGFQVQLDLVAGPGPSEGDGAIKGLVRLELLGMIY